MEFLKERVFTAVNADELKLGSKVICANNFDALRRKVYDLRDITILDEILEDSYERRFRGTTRGAWPLAYLISEPEEKKLKWTDLKIGDILREKNGTETRMVTVVDTSNEPDDEGDICHICLSDWWATDEELGEDWEKVE